MRPLREQARLDKSSEARCTRFSRRSSSCFRGVTTFFSASRCACAAAVGAEAADAAPSSSVAVCVAVAKSCFICLHIDNAKIAASSAAAAAFSAASCIGDEEVQRSSIAARCWLDSSSSSLDIALSAESSSKNDCADVNGRARNSSFSSASRMERYRTSSSAAMRI